MPEDEDIGGAATQVGSPTPTNPSLAGSLAGDLPTLIADRYSIQGLLGMGGMGRVYRAYDRALDEIVALKVLRRELVGMPGMLDRFRQEVKLARHVTSPHVVRTFDLGQHGDEHFLTMEYIDGRSLAQLLEDGPLPIDEVVRIARGAAAGIAAAHANGVLHRDLKPDNILVAKSGRIAITDFGIARPADATVGTGDRLAGTPAYMAPEQVEGATLLGPPVDVYAFGAIVFEMLVGRKPFVGSDAIAVAIARLREPPPDARAYRAVPGTLAELALRCMAREPTQRFLDGSALIGALGVLGDLTIAPEPARMILPVPTKSSSSLAVLPLRASGDLAELADGLSEEIVDALSMTRALRVRPLASVRGAMQGRSDTREIGQALGVDVVVDGSLRRRGEDVRLAARVIGVVDGFQLWASHVDTRGDELLAAGDQLARDIAQALTVELAVPERQAVESGVAEMYLELKARLRNSWVEGLLDEVVADADRAMTRAPDDVRLVATLAMALARSGFFGRQADLARARPLAERAVQLAPTSGETWLALAYACLYAGDTADAAGALVNAVSNAPGLAVAQNLLGEVLLEAGAMTHAIPHLEAALSLDPRSLQRTPLARAYFYEGRYQEAFDTLEKGPPTALGELTIGRFKMWRGERYRTRTAEPEGLRSELARLSAALTRFQASGVLRESDIAELDRIALTVGTRLRATQYQFIAECMLAAGHLDRGMGYIERAVSSGLQDLVWLERCPVLAPVRERPDFQASAAVVRERARAVTGALIEHVRQSSANDV